MAHLVSRLESGLMKNEQDASMPAAPVVEDDEDDDEQEANEQEPAGKFTEKVRLSPLGWDLGIL